MNKSSKSFTVKRWKTHPLFEFAGARMRALLTLDDTSKLACYHITVAKNGCVQSAYHKKAVELICILKGSGSARLGRRRVVLKKGDALFIYPPTPHGFIAGRAGMVMMAILTPRVDSQTDFYSHDESHPPPKVLAGRLRQGRRLPATARAR